MTPLQMAIIIVIIYSNPKMTIYAKIVHVGSNWYLCATYLFNTL